MKNKNIKKVMLKGRSQQNRKGKRRKIKEGEYG
jgi:hypothetical protein